MMDVRREMAPVAFGDRAHASVLDALADAAKLEVEDPALRNEWIEWARDARRLNERKNRIVHTQWIEPGAFGTAELVGVTPEGRRSAPSLTLADRRSLSVLATAADDLAHWLGELVSRTPGLLATQAQPSGTDPACAHRWTPHCRPPALHAQSQRDGSETRGTLMAGDGAHEESVVGAALKHALRTFGKRLRRSGRVLHRDSEKSVVGGAIKEALQWFGENVRREWNLLLSRSAPSKPDISLEELDKVEGIPAKSLLDTAMREINALAVEGSGVDLRSSALLAADVALLAVLIAGWSTLSAGRPMLIVLLLLVTAAVFLAAELFPSEFQLGADLGAFTRQSVQLADDSTTRPSTAEINRGLLYLALQALRTNERRVDRAADLSHRGFAFLVLSGLVWGILVFV